MRPLFRALVTASVLSLAALAGSSPATFAASDKAAAPWKYDFAWDYCWDGGTTDYCFDMKGRLHVTVLPNGTERATITAKQTTTIYENGVLVGTSVDSSLDKSVYVDGGQVYLHTVAHTNSTYMGEKCVITTVLKKVDFEIVLDHWNGPGCN